MFVRRNDGLGTVFLPFHVPALLIAALLTVRCGVRGVWAAAAFAGWWACAFLAVMLLFYIVTWIVSLNFSIDDPPPEEDHPVIRSIVVFVIGQLCRFARVRIHTSGMEKLPEGRFLIVSNHLSGYDPISTVWALRHTPTAIITKPENLRIPIAGPMIYRANYLPIDREDPREAMRTVQTAARLLKNDVVSIGVYPEGTRNRTPENGLLPFHNGVFKIAQRAEAPLVVATVHGTENIRKNFPLRHTDVYLDIREVIPAKELAGTTAALSGRVRRVMEGEAAEKAELT